MILQALSEYYQRKAQEGGNELPPIGFEKKEIPFLIVLDEEGHFVDLEDTRTGEGKKKTGRIFIVPQGEKRSGKNSWQTAFLLWDHIGYVLGYSTNDIERARKQQQSFLAKLELVFPDPAIDIGVDAVKKFLKKADFSQIYSHPLWQEIKDLNPNISFRLLNDDQLVCQREAVRRIIAKQTTDGKQQLQRCLVSGEMDATARLHPPIKGVRDRNGKISDTNIVSFNLAPFNSYGKTKGFNASIGERAAFAYTTALNHLLRKGSRQRLQVGDASTVFWAAQDHPSEEQFIAWLAPDPDDPDRGIEAICALYAAPKSGAKPLAEDDTPFYVLGLAPNAARIAVRFWYQGTVGELARHIRQHFDDTHIIHAPQEPEFLPLFRLLKASALQGKVENVPPNLAGDFMKAILAGTPYPRTLLAAALRRVRAEHHITYPRVALIKAVLTRNARLFNHPQQEVNVALDLKNLNIGYRLGRLFAVLERAQKLALPNVEATIRDRFYSAASSTPRTAFPHLLKLKNYHIDKLEEGQIIWLEKLMGEIMDGIEYFPAHLSLDDQGRFAVGYYHQRQAFFNKKNLDN